jgi:hypothetical protein
LNEFLRRQEIDAEGERDFIEIRFSVRAEDFIGEIKVTTHLTLDEAFRLALGQLLVYGHLRFDRLPGLIMFLDRPPDAKRLQLATRLGVAVVIEQAQGEFTLLNLAAAPTLATVFRTTEALGLRTTADCCCIESAAVA